MSDIDASRSLMTEGRTRSSRSASRAMLAPLALALLVSAFFLFPAAAFAGHSSTGELAFYPCTRCHPVFVDSAGNPTKPLPVGLKKHEITLEVHDILGKGDAACLACHDDPTRNPGKLLLADGSFVDVNGDVSRVCQRCHFEKYAEWQEGVHGKRKPGCTAAGCHDPHSPSWIYVSALPPFRGTGFEIRAVGADRTPFLAFAAPPLPPAPLTPAWLVIVASLGAAVSAGIIGYLVLGRPKR